MIKGSFTHLRNYRIWKKLTFNSKIGLCYQIVMEDWETITRLFGGKMVEFWAQIWTVGAWKTCSQVNSNYSKIFSIAYFTSRPTCFGKIMASYTQRRGEKEGRKGRQHMQAQGFATRSKNHKKRQTNTTKIHTASPHVTSLKALQLEEQKLIRFKVSTCERLCLSLWYHWSVTKSFQR